MAIIDFRPNRGKQVKDPKKPVSIYVRYQIGRKVDFNASIGAKVLIDNWDFDKKRVKNRNSILDKDEINELISKLYTHFSKYTSKNLTDGFTPNYKEVKEYFKSYFTDSNEEDPKQMNLFTYIDFIVERPETKRALTPNTIRTYTRTKKVLKDFNDSVYPIDFDSINLEWYNDFIEWCESKSFAKNYIGSHIKILKSIMTRANEDKTTDNLQYKSARFKVLREDADNIYLTQNELNQMWKLDLSKDSKKETARDLFLIGAYTGLRVSDYNNIKNENIKTVNGVKMFKIKTRKTGKEVAIPLHSIVLQILEKNNGKPPQRIPDQKINELIKGVCKSAGIDEVSYTTITRGGKEVKKKNYKYELVKSHTARRSFCTNAYLSNMSTIDIMAISSHTTEKAFLNYIKVTPEETAIRMSSHPFFNSESNLKVV